MLLLTKTRLYSHGDEAYIAAITIAGYEFPSFLRTGSRGGGIGFVTRTTMSSCVPFRALDYRSFEAVDMHLSLDHVSVVFVCLCRPPPSKHNNLTNSMFLEEFLELLSQYTDSRRDIVYLGDSNFHCDDSSDGQVSRLKTLLTDHNLTSAR